MKMTLKRALAMILSLALAIPGMAFAEEAPEALILLDEAASEEIEPYLPEIEEQPLEVFLPELESEPIFIEEASVDAALRVSFVTDPADASVTVYPAGAEGSTGVAAEADGAYLLPPGDYLYSVTAEGYEPIENAAFSVDMEDVEFYCALIPEGEGVEELVAEGSDEVEIELTEAEPAETAETFAVPFDRTCLVDDVIVSVKADSGVFPADAVLDVQRVPLYEQRRAEAAVDAARRGCQRGGQLHLRHPRAGRGGERASARRRAVRQRGLLDGRGGR